MSAGVIAESAARQTTRLAALLIAVNVLLPLVMWVEPLVDGTDYWREFRGERHAANWFSTVQCILIALVAYANHVAERTARRFGVGERARHPWAWLVFAAGFLFLAIDERFQVHEELRDRWLKPAGVFADNAFLSSGEGGLYLFFLVGLGLSVFLVDELRRARTAPALYGAALAMSLVVVVLDSLDRDFIRTWPFHPFWDYTFEELGELWAQLLFMLAFLRVLAPRLEQLGAAAAQEPVAGAP